MEILGYILAIGMGAVLGLIGAGGSILTVPILVYLLGVDTVTATGYSLLIVGLTSLIGVYHYYKKKKIDVRTAVIFAIPSLLAVYFTRRHLVPAMPDHFFDIGNLVITKELFIMLLFAVLMLLAAVLMIRPSNNMKPDKTLKKRKYTMITVEGLAVGSLTGLVGAGGGFMIIPALVLLAGLEMEIAVGTSLLIISAKSLLGFVGDLQAGIQLDYWMLSVFILCTGIGVTIGTLTSKTISGGSLKKLFGWFTLTIATIIIYTEL